MFKAKYHSSILFWDFNLINFIPSRIFHFSLSTSLIQTKRVYTFSLLLSLSSPRFQVTSPLPPLATVSSFISLLQINLGKVWFAFINSTCSPVLNAQLTTIPLNCSCTVTATSLWGPASEPTCCPFSSSPWFPQHCTLLVFLLPHFFSSPLLATLQLLLFSAFCTMGLISLGIGNLSHIYRAAVTTWTMKTPQSVFPDQVPLLYFRLICTTAWGHTHAHVPQTIQTLHARNLAHQCLSSWIPSPGESHHHSHSCPN